MTADAQVPSVAIPYRGSLAEDDYVEVVRLRRQVFREAGTAEDATVWFGAGFTALAAYGYLEGGNPEALWWLPFALLCFAIWWRRRENPGKRWRSTAALREENWGSVSQLALEARLGGVDARIPWSFFSAHVISRKVVLVIAGAHVYVGLAKSYFPTEEAWNQACSAVTMHVPPAKPGGRANLRTILWWVAGLTLLFLAWHFAQIQR